MQIVPVLDLVNGQVVRGIAGRRQEYRPIASALCPNAQPTTLAKSLVGELALREAYVADLDAIPTFEHTQRDRLAIHPRAMPRAEVAHLEALLRARDRRMLARDLVVLEDELVLLVPPDTQDVRERHGIGHLARLAHDEVGHGVSRAW